MKEFSIAVFVVVALVATYVGMFQLGKRYGAAETLASDYIGRAVQYGYRKGAEDALNGAVAK